MYPRGTELEQGDSGALLVGRGHQCDWSCPGIKLTVCHAAIAAATDITLSILPTVYLWNIKINRKVKFGVCCIMDLGFTSGGFASARTALVPSLTATQDPTWDLVPLFTWAVYRSHCSSSRARTKPLQPKELSDEDVHSERESGDLSHCAAGNSGILKTTDIHIIRSQPPNGDDNPRSSSVEKLVN
ncbi:hypothetical protein BGW36DRAFT_359889 [Talaromyces proteolyticus]|uniref:Rhodopsin domain-containing protein n=1 Tax=Talaromyces proteolyticus TaxID=1131652 RepID=A0AAD4KSD9_9EURO|nr:uncharacterized protein BGW36DRAFT_359889 [Talaromyces proteolyticus]KAH8696030.1 hypothetical protein BGW36DRAFT_359889 [Talaromyces proteolyticus]